ncbi:putative transmembrane sensor domain protein [Novosphingobium resinovorum]|uniref:Putative transmembrane sensor domain protein n=1 Tax=Novosphingobium resinovorum TaxID=158500 RepID=A0A031K3W2_9SPHN|nr:MULTISPECIES: CHASE2 domain-containing protein [Novosphingobium]EZP83925.1 putative transmembrane sensor domain protein [Novosphingobium resinovorum]
MTDTSRDAPHVRHGGLWQRMVVTILMGLIVATILIWSPIFLGVSLAPERLSMLLQDQAQRRSLPIVDHDDLPKISVIDMLPLGGPDRGLVSRSEVADTLKALDAAGARVILIDVDLSRPGNGDAQLINALRGLRQSQVILPVKLAPRSSKHCAARTNLDERAEQGLDQVSWPLAGAAALIPRVWYGHVETDADLDGVFRSVCPFVTAYAREPGSAAEPRAVAIPSAALLAAVLAEPSPIGSDRRRWNALLKDTMPTHGVIGLSVGAEGGNTLSNADTLPRQIHFLGQDATADDGAYPIPRTTLLPREMVTEEADRNIVAGSLVLIGSSSTLTGDRSPTPLGTMSGLFVVANLIANFAGDRFLTYPENHLAHFLFECLLVALGAVLFVGLYDGLAQRLARSKWGLAARLSKLGRLLSSLLKAFWLIALSLLIGAALIELQAWLAAHSIAAGVSVDPAIGVLAILAERIIHVAGALEEKLRDFVATNATRFSRNGPNLPKSDGPREQPEPGDYLSAERASS